MKKTLLTFVSAIVLLIVCVAATAGYFAYDFVEKPASAQGREIVYEVIPGKKFGIIAKELEQAGVVRNGEFFNLYSRITGKRAHLKVGEYALNTSMTPAEVMNVLISGHSIARPFTVSEGLNIFEIADLYESSGFGKAEDFRKLALDPSLAHQLIGPEATNLEGYLFPETYQITKFTTTRELIGAMIKRFQAVYKEIEPLVPATKLTKHQVVTLASIIEKETGAPSERELVSSVFHNRLDQHMRLQTDPTIIYGIAIETGKIPSNISKADILRPTAYNTYTIPALPPGPVSNPGRDSLMAAVKWKPTTFLYFVSRNDGTHVYTSTYPEHEAAVRKFQLDPKARAGKSWRDLKKTATTPGAEVPQGSGVGAATPGTVPVKR